MPLPFVHELAQDALARLDTRAALAEGLGVSKQHLARVLAREAGFGPLALVRAARITERNPLEVLRKGGEQELADELEALLGDRLTAAQRSFLDEWDKLPAKVRRPLRAAVKAWAEGEAVAPAPPTKRARKRP